MARLNGTAPTYSEWFEDFSDNDLAIFIHSTRGYAARLGLTATLSTAADIASRLA